MGWGWVDSGERTCVNTASETSMGEGLLTEDTRHSLPSTVTELPSTFTKADRTQKGGWRWSGFRGFPSADPSAAGTGKHFLKGSK